MRFILTRKNPNGISPSNGAIIFAPAPVHVAFNTIFIHQWSSLGCVANDKLRDIVMASDEDGYEALYNILRLVHPKLTNMKVETKIPCQGISDTFAHHVKNIRITIENEAIHGRVYTCYEGLELVLGTLHPKD
jgi:hypothetical protein